jgi:hypothetical protein
MIMELIRTLREKRISAHQNDLQQQAIDLITLADFDDKMYVAFNGMPLVEIESQWSVKEILQQLNIIRQNYVNCQMKDRSIPQVTTVA